MNRIEAMWLAVKPVDLRCGAERLLAHVVQVSAIVRKDAGLRTDRRISHVFVFDLPRYHKLLALAGCVVNIAPDLKTKSDILTNAIDLLGRLPGRKQRSRDRSASTT